MEEEMNMSSCYPTGCPGPNDCIDFPENPADGQVECVVIDALGTQKCWVYDKCIPGWRAQGTSPSPVKYRGGIDLTQTRASQYPKITAGDFFVVTVDANASTPANYPGLSATVKAGERVVWSGSDWQVVLPIVPYAEEALGNVPLVEDPDADDFGKPVDDPRIAGIVKNATLSQALAGTDKCDTITPYTLKGVVGDIIDFTPTKPDPNGGVVVEINEGANLAQCINNTTLVLSATATATATDGSTAIGRWKYQWSEGGNDLREVRAETVSGGSTDTLTIDGFTITPVTGTRTFKVKATFTDLFGDDTTAEDTIDVTFANAAEITSQPAELDLTTNTTGTISVTAEPVNADLAAPALTFKWYVNNVEITGATTPDIGYTFADFTTATLGVTRTAADAGTYSVYAEVTGGCQGMLSSDPAFLKGPGGEDGATIIQPPPGTGYLSIGSYTLWTPNPRPFQTYTFGSLVSNQPGLPGTWRVMGGIVAAVSSSQPQAGSNTQISTIANKYTYLVVRVS